MCFSSPVDSQWGHGLEPSLPSSHPSNAAEAAAVPHILPVPTVDPDKRFRALSPAFKSIEEQLRQNFPEALGKLRDPDLDFTRAQIALRCRKKIAGPFQLSDFAIVDFAQACADELGCGGPVGVTVDPNDGRSPRFSFGFLAPTPVESAAGDANASIQAQIEALKQEIRRGAQLGALGTTQAPLDVSTVRRQVLEELQMMKQIFSQPEAPKVDSAGQMKEMAAAMGQMVGSTVEIVQKIGQAGQALNPAAGEAAKAQAWLGVAKEGLPLVKEAAGAVKDMMVKPPAGLTDGAKEALVGVA